MRRHGAMAVVDTMVLLAFLALSEPGSVTGFDAHEWLGLAFVLLVVLHLVLSWSWVPVTLRRLRARGDTRVRINALLNATLFVMMTVATVSGLIISDYVAALVGFPTSDDPRWRQVHNMTASFLLVVVGLHAALNWTWIRAAFRRYVIAPLGARTRETRAP